MERPPSRRQRGDRHGGSEGKAEQDPRRAIVTGAALATDPLAYAEYHFKHGPGRDRCVENDHYRRPVMTMWRSLTWSMRSPVTPASTSWIATSSGM